MRSEPLMRELLGDWAETVLEFSASFERHRPKEPHFYLSLLATRPDRRGRGEGMGLLDENLALIDAEGGPPISSRRTPRTTALRAAGFTQGGRVPGPGRGAARRLHVPPAPLTRGARFCNPAGSATWFSVLPIRVGNGRAG